MVQEAAEPRVIVYVHHDESRPTLLQIVIKNIGSGVASDVVFRFSKHPPERAFGLGDIPSRPVEAMSSGPLIDGIPLLAPGETRRITWGQYGGLHSAIGDDYITVTCIYSHEGKALRTSSRLEVRSFNRTDANESESRQMIKELHRIGSAAESLQRAVQVLAANDSGRVASNLRDEDSVQNTE